MIDRKETVSSTSMPLNAAAIIRKKRKLFEKNVQNVAKEKLVGKELRRANLSKMASLAKNYHQVMRLFSTARILRQIESKAANPGEHGDYKIWKKLFFFGCVPAIGLCMLNCYIDHTSGHHEPPPFVAYEHLRIRNKKFPWGDGNHSLFHSHMNALPDGYEH